MLLLSYKENCNINDGSYINLICYYLNKNKVFFKIIDPLLSPIELEEKEYLIFLGHQNLYFKPKKNSIIIDVWRKIKSNNYKIIFY